MFPFGKAPVGAGFGDRAGEAAGVEARGMSGNGWIAELGKPQEVSQVSSGSKAGKPSDRHASRGGGVARSTGEAGQRPWREGAAQGKLLDEGTTAASEAEQPASLKLAEPAARARKEVCI